MANKKVEVIETDRKKKVAIIGFASSWNQAPWDDNDFEIWGLNELYKLVQTLPRQVRFDRWFEIHNPLSPSKNTKEHHDWLKVCPIPLYMQRKYPEFPASVEYPRDQVKAFFNRNFVFPGSNNTDTVTETTQKGSRFADYSNQISWMLALAIYEGFEEIHIYGVDMAQKSEYAFQRSSCQFFIGYAAGLGIKVLIPQNSELCKFGQDYGYDTDNQTRITFKRDIKDLKSRKNNILIEMQKIKQREKELEVGMCQIDGAITKLNHYLSNHIV